MKTSKLLSLRSVKHTSIAISGGFSTPVWSAIKGMNNLSYDRTPEQISRVREGWDG